MKSLTPGNNWYARSLWIRVLTFIAFVIFVNILAGYTAIYFDYPSLWNVDPDFSEYALPVPFTWALAHWPSMLIFGVPLLSVSITQTRSIYRYRLISTAVFLLCLLELDAKIPFLLFPKIDAMTAFLFSLVIAPPNRQHNPVLLPIVRVSLIIIVLLSIYMAASAWQHRTPQIKSVQIMEGLFNLKSIEVNNDFRQEMNFMVELKEELPKKQACESAQIMAGQLLREYPFDDSYRKTVYITFNPDQSSAGVSPYSLGEVSLNSEDRDSSGQFPCYIKYK
ncbi:MAG: hypothetical protein OQL16_14575 [Gammaproteobacteria bacterium]|nr:hypothetical protein [Gammaproteobacteria bacterium]